MANDDARANGPLRSKLSPKRIDELVAGCQKGETGAFRDLYSAYFDRIYGYVSVILRDRHEAEDVTQQVFVKAMQGVGRYEGRPSESFDAWLFSIARNAVMDVMRRRRRVTVEDPATIDDRRSHNGEREQALEDLSQLSDSDVAMFLDRLPDAQRDAIVLRFVLGLSAAEVARAMNRRTEAVRALQSRGLRTLEQRLVAMGSRSSSGRKRMPTRTRVRPAPVMAARRFALGVPGQSRAPLAASRARF